MKCRECGTENPVARKFCRECGARLPLPCSQCGFENLPGDKFCGECGHDLRKPSEPSDRIDCSQPQSYTPKSLAEKILTTRSSIEGERKLVTVLFTDVANCTAISEKLDPEEVHRIMDGCFRILADEIHRYEGTINQFTGDGVMALFGAPLAHEDHAQRACHAALSIQKAIAEYGEKVRRDCGVDFRIRVGLNSGPVIVGTIGDDLRMDYTAIGDTTNLASRMETMAAPGTVRVSEHTRRLARDYFEFTSLGEVAVKGKERPQPAYELLRPGEVATRIGASVARGLTKFVGRKKQMEALREVFDKTRAGSGHVVGIVGEAGVGKSRLVLELRDRLPKESCAYLEGRCLHFGGAMPYLPILDIVKSHFDIEEEDREYLIKKKVRERLIRLDGKLLASLPSFHEILSVPVEDEKYLQIEPQQRRQRIFEAIRDLLLRESQVEPLLLAVEDLHWIDKTSREFLDYLIGWMANSRILLVLLYRPEFTHTWGCKSYYTQIGLGQLSARTSAELVQAIFEEGEVVPELKDFILGRAGGNPLFVEELTHSLIENGSIHRKDDRHVLTRKASEIQVPDTIQGIIAARMDRLEERLKRIMQVASVIGREFAYRLLATITGMKEDLKASLLNLQGLEFIYEKQLFPELEYIFKHVLTQEVAYNSLLLKHRRELHEKTGQAIEQVYAERLEEYYELLAYHYVHSDNSAKALEYLDLANKKAASGNAIEDAKAYFDKATELLDTLPDTEQNRERRISLLANQGNVFYLLMQLKEYYDLLDRYESDADRLPNQGLRGAFYARRGLFEFQLGHLDQAIETLTRALELCESAGYTEDAGMAYFFLASCHLWRADYDRVLELVEDLLRTMERRFHLRTYVRGLGTAACQACAQMGRWDEAVEFGRKALSAAQDYSDHSLIAHAATSLAGVYTYKRDLDQAIHYAELALAEAQTPADKAMAKGFLAWPLCHAGEPHRGIEILVGILPVLKAVGFRTLELWFTLFLLDGYWQKREWEKGRQTAEDLLHLSETCGARFCIGYAHLLMGEMSLETDPAQAAAHFDKSIDVFPEIKAENVLAMAYAGYGRLHKQQGNVEQARDFLTRALSIFERLGTLMEPDKVRKELAELPE